MMTNRVVVEPSLAAAVAGDLHAFLAFVRRPSAQDEASLHRSAALVLTREALRAVLDALESGTAPPDVVQLWASFVRRGYLVHTGGHQTGPFDIRFGTHDEDEDVLVDVIARLDELGDAIDGHIGGEEIAVLRDRLAESG